MNDTDDYRPGIGLGPGQWMPDQRGILRWTPVTAMAVCECCGRAEQMAHGGVA